jgi:hypothetical protein
MKRYILNGIIFVQRPFNLGHYYSDLIDLYIYEGQLLHLGATPLDSISNEEQGTGSKISNCCADSVRVVGETTKHYECTACGKPCDLWHKSSPKQDEEIDEIKTPDGRYNLKFYRWMQSVTSAINKLQRGE